MPAPPKLGDLLADRLVAIVRDLCPAADRAARIAETPAKPRRFYVAWHDDCPAVYGTSMILEWWPDHPEIRSRVLSLLPGECWTDPELDPQGVPLCAVIRLE